MENHAGCCLELRFGLIVPSVVTFSSTMLSSPFQFTFDFTILEIRLEASFAVSPSLATPSEHSFHELQESQELLQHGGRVTCIT